MIALVFQVLISMLCGIMVYETVKFAKRSLEDYRTRKECDHYEAREFHRCLTGSLDKAFRNLSEKEIREELEKEQNV
jgi:hypothetical protein